MSYLSVWVHFVWTTKNRIPFLKDEIRDDLIIHIRNNALKKNIFIDRINGSTEHLHALLSLGGNQSLSELMRLIKGESSYWINKEKLTRLKFEWQDDYYAVSIGMSQIDNLRNYISNQAIHHKIIHFEDELDRLIKEYQLKKFKD